MFLYVFVCFWRAFLKRADEFLARFFLKRALED